MYLKKQLKKRVLISVATVIALALTIAGTSYGLFLDVKTDIKTQVLSVGDLQVTYTTGTAISLDEIKPMSDEIALNESNNIYTFGVENTGNVPYSYTVALENNPALLDRKLLSHDYIRYDLNNTGPNLLGNQPNNIIYSATLQPGRAELFSLKLWVADATLYKLPNEAQGSEIHLNIVIKGKAGIINEPVTSLLVEEAEEI